MMPLSYQHIEDEIELYLRSSKSPKRFVGALFGASEHAVISEARKWLTKHPVPLDDKGVASKDQMLADEDVYGFFQMLALNCPTRAHTNSFVFCKKIIGKHLGHSVVTLDFLNNHQSIFLADNPDGFEQFLRLSAPSPDVSEDGSVSSDVTEDRSHSPLHLMCLNDIDTGLDEYTGRSRSIVRAMGSVEQSLISAVRSWRNEIRCEVNQPLSVDQLYSFLQILSRHEPSDGLSNSFNFYSTMLERCLGPNSQSTFECLASYGVFESEEGSHSKEFNDLLNADNKREFLNDFLRDRMPQGCQPREDHDDSSERLSI